MAKQNKVNIEKSNKNDEIQPKIKKKRGRKPKNKQPDTLTGGVKVKKKRGRKPKFHYNVEVYKLYNENLFESDKKFRDLIVHLPIDIEKVDKKNTPQPIKSASTLECSIIGSHKSNNNIVIDNSLNVQDLFCPDSTDKLKNIYCSDVLFTKNCGIKCFWCTHNFKNYPYSIPMNKKNNKYFSYGIFCSLQCASAYIFDDSISEIEKIYRYNLLNEVYYDIIDATQIIPSLPKEVLKDFGGKMDIQVYRKYNNIKNKNFIKTFPPLKLNIPQLKEIVLNDTCKKEFIIHSEEKPKLKIKRKKPIFNDSSILDTCMNIVYN